MNSIINYKDKTIDFVVEGIKHNNESACAEFYNRTYKTAYSITIQMVKNEADAMDILQDSYVTAFKKMETLEDESKAISWFNMIVNNRCKDFLKKKKPTLFNEMDTEDIEFEDTLVNENEEFKPEESVDYSETKRLMMEILDGLSEEQKMCVLMYYYEDLTVKEIAESLECSENTVKSRLNYARKNIKEEVLALEKKGTKLYGIFAIPFIAWMLKEGESAYAASDLLFKNILAKAGIGSQTAAAATAAGKAAATGAAAGSKTIATKIVAGVIAAVVAVGGIAVGVNQLKSNNSGEKGFLGSLFAPKYEASVDAIEEDYLKGLLYYTPVFDEDDPISDTEAYTFMKYSLLYKYLEMDGNTYDGQIFYATHLNDEDVIVTNREIWNGNFDVIQCKVERFDEILKQAGYQGDIDESFIDDIYASEGFFVEDGYVTLVMEGLGGFANDWEIEILNKVANEEFLTVQYMLYETDWIEDSKVYSIRTAEIELTEEGYIFRSVVEDGETTGALNITEECNGLDEWLERQEDFSGTKTFKEADGNQLIEITFIDDMTIDFTAVELGYNYTLSCNYQYQPGDGTTVYDAGGTDGPGHIFVTYDPEGETLDVSGSAGFDGLYELQE